MTTNHGDTETAAREALDEALTWIASEIEHRDKGGQPRFVSLTTAELIALAALRPASPSEVTVTEAMVEVGVRASTEIWQAFPDLTADTVDKCRKAAMRAALTAALSARPTAPDGVAAEWQAIEDAASWHDRQEKALSKQPPGGDRDWRRNEHREQAECLRAALRPATQTTETEATDGR